MAQRVVAEYGLKAEVEEVEVATNEVVRRRFLGSPTVQVGGADIDPAARERTDFAMSCRVYATPDGLPTEAMLLNALGVSAARAATPRMDRAGAVAIGGSVATAVLSSACCWLPLLLLAFGASAAGASAFFERWRVLFVTVAIAMLGLGFYWSYFRKTTCGEGCCNPGPRRSRRIQRSMLWGSAVVVSAFILFPSYVGVLLGGGSSTAGHAAGADAREYVFEVEGMHCEGCAVTLRAELMKIDGVLDAQVDYGSRIAHLRAAGGGIESRVGDVALRLGYDATAEPAEER